MTTTADTQLNSDQSTLLYHTPWYANPVSPQQYLKLEVYKALLSSDPFNWTQGQLKEYADTIYAEIMATK